MKQPKVCAKTQFNPPEPSVPAPLRTRFHDIKDTKWYKIVPGNV